jgi:hypothetical protein
MFAALPCIKPSEDAQFSFKSSIYDESKSFARFFRKLDEKDEFGLL